MSRLQLVFRVLIALAVTATLGFTLCSFQVASHESVVLTRFGSPVAVVTAPGLHGKWPWPIDTVNRFDTRLTFQETRISEALTRDKRNVIVPLYLAWRVADPLKFLQSTGTTDTVAAKLDSLATSARNTLLGRLDFAELVNAEAPRVRLPALETELAELIRPQALAAFGVAIEEVGLRRIALPEANTVFVFERMRAERAQYAARFRAEGRREAAEIRTQAEAEKTVLLAEAQRYAEETRGRAEAEAARTYAAAHAQAPELYQLTRELEALRASVKDNTTLVLDTATPPFTALKDTATPQP